MKVLHLLYAHTIGGAEKYLYYLLPHMAEKGIDCHIFIVTTPESESLFSSYRDQFTVAGIKSGFAISTRSGFFKTAKAVSEYMKQNDISYLHSHLFNSDLIAVLAKKFFNKNIVTISTKHGYREDILNIIPEVKNVVELKKIARKTPYYFISRWIVSNTDHNYAVSKALSDFFFNIGLSKTAMPFIHHGVEMAVSATQENPAYKVSDQQFVIVGRLEQCKGHSYLLEAMVKVSEKYPEARLLVIGDGPQKENLKAQSASLGINEKVLFLGFQKDPYSYVRQSEVIVLPALFESFGLVYIEAFALETPVVAFDTAAGNELIDNNENGLLVPAKDSNGLAEKMIFLLEHPDVAKQIAANAKKKYDVYFSTERMVAQTADYYKTIAAGGSGV